MTSRRRRVPTQQDPVVSPPIVPQTNNSIEIIPPVMKNDINNQNIINQEGFAQYSANNAIYNQTPPPYLHEQLREPNITASNEIGSTSSRRRRVKNLSDVNIKTIPDYQKSFDNSQAESFFDTIPESDINDVKINLRKSDINRIQFQNDASVSQQEVQNAQNFVQESTPSILANQFFDNIQIDSILVPVNQKQPIDTPVSKQQLSMPMQPSIPLQIVQPPAQSFPQIPTQLPLQNTQNFSTTQQSSLFPLYSLNQLPAVINFCNEQLTQSQGINKLFYASILYRFQQKHHLTTLLTANFNFNTTFDIINTYILQNQPDKALAFSIINNLEISTKLAHSILNNDKILPIYQSQFLNHLQSPTDPSDFLLYLNKNSQHELASALLICLNFSYEPTNNFGFPVDTSVQFDDSEAFKTIQEIIEFSQLVLIAQNIKLQSVNNTNLENLPFCPFLLENKLVKAQSNPYYNLVVLTHLQTILKKLASKQINSKQITFKQSKYFKFVALQSVEMQNFCTENGKIIYQFRDQNVSLEMKENVNEVGRYLEVSGVGERFTGFLNRGIGRLLGTQE